MAARSKIQSLVTAADGSLSVDVPIETSRLVGARLEIGSLTAAAEVWVLTLTTFANADSFKITQSGVSTVAFVHGVNATQAAIQAALRTLTGDNGLTAVGTADVGPFTITFSASVGDPAPLTITAQTGTSDVAIAETVEGSVITLTSLNRAVLTLKNWSTSAYFPIGELVDTAAGAASASYGGGGAVVHGAVTVAIEGGGNAKSGTLTLFYEAD